MMKPKTALIAGCALLAVATAWLTVDYLDAPETHVIEASYAFDVTDPELVAGYVDALALVTVNSDGERASTDVGMWTDYEVSVQEVLKGDLSQNTTTVRQHGGHDGEDVIVTEGQPLLESGGHYVLALTRSSSDGPWTVIGGPLSAKKLPAQASERAQVVTAWRTAVAHQRKPAVP